MVDEVKERRESQMREYLMARVSRAQLLKAAAAGLAIAAVPSVAAADDSGRAPYQSFPFFPQITSGTYTPENIGDILNIAVTAEHLAVTVLTAAVGSLGLSGLPLAVVQAALAEEQYHADFLMAAGATPLTDTFTVPNPKILTDQTTFFETIEVAESIFIGAYMTATREFAELGQPTLAKYAYQIGGVEAEHRTLARAALILGGNSSFIPPNNKAFETDLFLYVRDAAALLEQLGFIGGTGTPATYPGRAAALAAAGSIGSGVIQQTPNNATSSVTSSSNLTGPQT